MSEISQRLQRGLQSLSQGDDGTAFQHLTQVLADLEQAGIVDTSDGWKAQMGLVTLHQRAGNLTIAQNLAQSLSLVRNSKVSEWAKAQLATIEATINTTKPSQPTHWNGSSYSPSSEIGRASCRERV